MPRTVPDEFDLRPPDAEEVSIMCRAFQTAAAPPGGLTATQRMLMEAIVPAMTGFPAAMDQPSLDPQQFATTLGRRVTQLYQARGFTYPGRPGSAPPLLAQHDWVHVLADYGTTVEAELEVFAFIARANDDPHAFSLLAMVVSLFETGYLRSGAGLFEYSTGHLSETGMSARLADALRRGALCPGSNDFLATDWFALADLPVDEARERFGVPPRSAAAIEAGSRTPWEAGGITPFQARAGAALADASGRPYRDFGATPAPPAS